MQIALRPIDCKNNKIFDSISNFGLLHRSYKFQNICVGFEEWVEGLIILPEFRGWVLEVLNENNDREIKDRSKVYEMQQENLITTQKELNNLTKMRYRDLIDDESLLRSETNFREKLLR